MPGDIPVIVGVGRTTQRRCSNLADAHDPIELGCIATKKALQDAGVDQSAVESVMFVAMAGETRMPWGKGPAYTNPALSLVNQMGMDGNKVETMLSRECGNQSQYAVNMACERISKGEADGCLVVGAEAIDTLMLALKKGYKLSKTEKTNDEKKVLHWGDDPGRKPIMFGSNERWISVKDFAHGLTAMPAAYALVENAVRRKDNVSPRDRMIGNAKLFHGFNKVALEPENIDHSWFTKEYTEEDFITVDKSNRMVAEPYPKLFCAVMDVNMASSILIMSEKKAKALGIPAEKYVYLHGCGDCNDVGPEVLAKPDPTRCPGMEIAAKTALATANVSLQDTNKEWLFDIYSCFPIAVRMACREMGIDKLFDIEKESHRLTQTGGLPFMGGPGNEYSSHGICRMVENLRQNPRAFGFVNANGGVLSKHSVGIYSCVPYAETHRDHPDAWVRGDCAEELKRAREMTPPRRVAPNKNYGPCEGVIKNYTVTFKPDRVICYGDIITGPETGKRFVATSTEDAMVKAFSGDLDRFLEQKVSITTEDMTGGKGKIFAATFQLLTGGANL